MHVFLVQSRSCDVLFHAADLHPGEIKRWTVIWEHKTPQDPPASVEKYLLWPPKCVVSDNCLPYNYRANLTPHGESGDSATGKRDALPMACDHQHFGRSKSDCIIRSGLIRSRSPPWTPRQHCDHNYWLPTMDQFYKTIPDSLVQWLCEQKAFANSVEKVKQDKSNETIER